MLFPTSTRRRQKRSVCSLSGESKRDAGGFSAEKGAQSSSFFESQGHSALGLRSEDVPTILWRETFNILISRPPELGQTRRATRFLDPDVASYNRAYCAPFISHVTRLQYSLGFFRTRVEGSFNLSLPCHRSLTQ